MTGITYHGERPACMACLRAWENKQQRPWICVIRGEEPYKFACSWACLSVWAGNQAKEEV